MRKILKTFLPNNFNTQIAFRGTKPDSCFKIKNTVNFKHKHNIVYREKCPANKCKDDCVGKTGRRISEMMMDHDSRDVNSLLLKHNMEKEHQCLQNKDFLILSSGFWNTTIKKKVSEALWIKDLKPTLK